MHDINFPNENHAPIPKRSVLTDENHAHANEKIYWNPLLLSPLRTCSSAIRTIDLPLEKHATIRKLKAKSKTIARHARLCIQLTYVDTCARDTVRRDKIYPLAFTRRVVGTR